MLACLVTSIAFAQIALADDWDDAQRQPAAWFRTAEAQPVVDNVLRYQLPSGGWPKNLDMAAPLDDAAKVRLAAQTAGSTIDNNATVSQVRFLARAYAEIKADATKIAVVKGLDYLLAAQYENGGWPQDFPDPRGYHAHITFNDNAMAGVLTLLQDVSLQRAPFTFVDADRRARAQAAVARGVDCILKCQVFVDGRRTAWCAQHDEKTFAPAPARAFEPVSLSGSESVGLVRYLMEIEEPSPEVIESVKSAVAWLESVKLTGLRVASVQTPAGPDRVVVADASAAPLWARFYEIGTNRPLFTGRNGIVRADYAEIERERRTGYAYYGNWPARLIDLEFPAWASRLKLPILDERR
jgi:PelA/Pel-15E family pectate lyase